MLKLKKLMSGTSFFRVSDLKVCRFQWESGENSLTEVNVSKLEEW